MFTGSYLYGRDHYIDSGEIIVNIMKIMFCMEDRKRTIIKQWQGIDNEKQIMEIERA